MSVHIWWSNDAALCGSTEIGHAEPCLSAGKPWPGLLWEDVACQACGVPACRGCMRIAATRHGHPLDEVALLRLPRLVVSV